MRVLVLFFLAACSLFAAAGDLSTENAIGKIPLRFERDSSHSWTARSLGFTVSVTGDSALVGLGKESMRVQFLGSDPNAGFRGEKKSQAPNNYFVGNNAVSLDAYMQLRRTNIYPDIDMVYYGSGQSMEYDFELGPGADVSRIRMRFEGPQDAHIAQDGSLTLTLASGTVTQKAPVTYQHLKDGSIISIPSRYVEETEGIFALKLAAYDETRPLIVDPVLIFAGYLQGSGSEGPLSVNLDKDGIVYIAGYTLSRNFPLVCGCAYTDVMAEIDPITFTTKLNPFAPPGGDVILYSGFFGGQFGNTLRAATVDPDGVFYLTGYTDDVLFPTTPNAYSRESDSRRLFLSAVDTKISGTDSLVYSTFFGGSTPGLEETTSIALGPTSGQVAIAGFTNKDSFPQKNNFSGPIGSMDGFIALFDLTQSGQNSLLASTYIGGTGFDVPRGIAFDAAGKIYIAGYTQSGDFPITADAFQPWHGGGGEDAFVARVDMLGAWIEYGTFLGGNGIDQAWDVVLDAEGRIALTGFTLSNSFPTTTSAFQPTPGGDGDAFLTIFDLRNPPGQAIAYSTLYGGSAADVGQSLRIGPNGNYYLGGYTLSRNLRTEDALNPVSAGAGTDGFVAIVDPSDPGTRGLVYSSYVTGPGFQTIAALDVDKDGNVYVVGQAYSTVFGPNLPPDPNSNTNVFFFVFRPSDPALVSRRSPTVRTKNSRSRY